MSWQRPVVLEHGATPRSLNRSNHPDSHWRFLAAKREWEELLGFLLMEAGLPRGQVAHVHADALLRFPVRRRRDEGNFRAVLEKALGDALHGGGWIVDDTPEFFRFGLLAFESERGPSRTRIRLAWKRRPAPATSDATGGRP